MGGLFILFTFLFSLLSRPALAASFTDPLYEELDVSRLEARRASPGDDRAAHIQASLFLIEALERRGAPTRAEKLRKELQAACGDVLVEGKKIESEAEARISLTCAIAWAEQARRRHPLFQRGVAERALRALRDGGEKASNVDRFYAEGRVYYILPAGAGRSWGKSLLGWTFLKKIEPQSSSVDVWMGIVYEAQGNEEKARESFEIALAKKPADARARLLFPEGRFRRSRERVDGASSGIMPGIFVLPALGLGAYLSAWDSRMFDTDRLGRSDLWITTNGSFGGHWVYRDRALFPPAGILFDMEYRDGREEFYGIGMTSLKTDRSQLQIRRIGLNLAVEHPLADYTFLEVGWQIAAFDVISSAGGVFLFTALPSRSQTTHTGPTGGLVFDNRDSAGYPRHGGRLEARGYFPWRSLGVSSAFQKWRVHGEWNFRLASKHTLTIEGGTEWVSGAAPYGAFPKLGASLGLPGTREFRHQDRAVIGTVLSERFNLWDVLSLKGFLTWGNVAGSFSSLFSAGSKMGGGLALLMHPTDPHSPAAEIEAGWLGREFTFRAGGVVRF